jgi:hypothetical protein
MMIIMHPNATTIPEPVTIDIAKLIATSTLVGKGTFGPLPRHVRELIQQTIQKQLVAKKQGDLLPTNYIISGPGSRTSRAMVSSRQDARIPAFLRGSSVQAGSAQGQGQDPAPGPGPGPGPGPINPPFP